MSKKATSDLYWILWIWKQITINNGHRPTRARPTAIAQGQPGQRATTRETKPLFFKEKLRSIRSKITLSAVIMIKIIISKTKMSTSKNSKNSSWNVNKKLCVCLVNLPNVKILRHFILMFGRTVGRLKILRRTNDNLDQCGSHQRLLATLQHSSNFTGFSVENSEPTESHEINLEKVEMMEVLQASAADEDGT